MSIGKGPSGPSAAELQAIARQEAEREMAKIKQEQDFEKQKFDTQMAFEKEQATLRQNELKTKAEIDKAAQQEERQRIEAEEKAKMEEEMKKQNQSITASQSQAAADAARRKTFLESVWYLDNDDELDPANQSTAAKRAAKSKASAL